MSFITKINVVILSWIVALAVLFVNNVGTVSICAGESACISGVAMGMRVLFPFLPLAALSLVAYFLRDDVFKSWIRFALWWVPLSMLAIFFWQDETGALFTVGKQTIAWLLSAMFLLISLILIAYKTFAKAQKKASDKSYS